MSRADAERVSTGGYRALSRDLHTTIAARLDEMLGRAP
jgi:hypothetical protein